MLFVAATAVVGQVAPVAYWQFDETAGTVASDSSGNGNDGTLVGFGTTSWGPGNLGGGLFFSGAQHVTLPSGSGLPVYDTSGAPFTLSFWVNAPQQHQRVFYSEASSSNSLSRYNIGTGRVNTGTMDRLRMEIRNSSGIFILRAETSATVFDNTWHHVAIVDQGGTVTLYVDGAVDFGNFSYGISGSQGTVDQIEFGRWAGLATCCNFIGTLDDFRVYPYALSVFDVATVMANGTLVAGYQQNQPGASMEVSGAVGSVTSAAQVIFAPGQVFPLTLSTNLAGNPWEIGVDAAIAIPNAAVLNANIVNLDINSPNLTLLNNNFSTPFGLTLGLPGSTTGSGTVVSVLSLQAPITTTLACLQFAMVDPSNPDGMVLSASANLSVP